MKPNHKTDMSGFKAQAAAERIKTIVFRSTSVIDTPAGCMRVNPTTERDHAREEYYTSTSREEFGINKRTRRLKRGHQNVTTPDGTRIANKSH